MHIELEFDIDSSADAAWRAVHDPTVVAALYGTVMQLRPLTPMPVRFEDGSEVDVALRAAGILPAGRQRIRITDEVTGTGPSQVRTMHDRGQPLSGPLALLRGWHHRMTITDSPAHPGHAIWRDRLDVSGAFAPFVWPLLRITWAWRARRIRALAPSWR